MSEIIITNMEQHHLYIDILNDIRDNFKNGYLAIIDESTKQNEGI